MNYENLFSRIREMALRGTVDDVNRIMDILDRGDLPVSRGVDYYLGLLTSEEGIERLTHYLFEGTRIQRNYCALFFERRNDWDLINRAYGEGRIDYLQAYSR
ncbi:MAG: hypothetical protein JXA95_01420 [Spirochaetales bacterium]|jgi:hypothetical protein|nr:hypothetical protein [Spirochaetales bacterium]